MRQPAKQELPTKGNLPESEETRNEGQIIMEEFPKLLDELQFKIDGVYKRANFIYPFPDDAAKSFDVVRSTPAADANGLIQNVLRGLDALKRISSQLEIINDHFSSIL